MITLHYHPLSSYCWKVLVALYETETPFVGNVVDLGDAAQREALLRLWPFGKFPVITDEGQVVAESTTILEHLAAHHPRCAALFPPDRAARLEARRMDRVFDLYVHDPMQRLADDRIRAEDARDPLGAPRARATLATAYAMLERTLQGRPYAAGETFTIADCAAAPALHYANRMVPLGEAHPHVRAYLTRLEARPTFARVLAEAAPFDHMFPKERDT